MTAVSLPPAVVAVILNTLKDELSSASVSPNKTSKAPSVTVSVFSTATLSDSSSATGASFIPITVIVKVAVDSSVPSETV